MSTICSFSRKFFSVALPVLLLGSVAGSVLADHPPAETGDCYFKKFDEVPGGGGIITNQYCTAGDIDLGVVNAIILDGCDSTSDTLKLAFQGTLTSTSQTRYDPAFSININGFLDPVTIGNKTLYRGAVTDTTDGPNGDGACLTQYLPEADPTPPGTNVNISGGHGPWKGIDGYFLPDLNRWLDPNSTPPVTDACADAVQGGVNVINVGDPFTDPIELSCEGFDPTTGNFAFAYLISWDNLGTNKETVITATPVAPNGNQLCPEDPDNNDNCNYWACDTLDEAHFTEQSSKCRVGLHQTSTGIPNIEVTKSCIVTHISDVNVPLDTVIGPGGIMECEITVTNLPEDLGDGTFRTPSCATLRHVVDDFTEDTIGQVYDFELFTYDSGGNPSGPYTPNHVTFGDTATPDGTIDDVLGVLDPTLGVGDYGGLQPGGTPGTIPDDLGGTFIWAINGGGYEVQESGTPGQPDYIPRGCNVPPMTGQEKYVLKFMMKVKSLEELQALPGGFPNDPNVVACNDVYSARNNTFDLEQQCVGAPLGSDFAQDCADLLIAGEIGDFKINYWLDSISASLLDTNTPLVPMVPRDIVGDPYYQLLRGELQDVAIPADMDGSAGCFLVTPANVVGMHAVSDGDGIALQWQTDSESGTAGFHIERRDSEEGEWQRLNDKLLPVNLNSMIGSTYQFSDSGATSKGNYSYSYRLVEVEQNGKTIIHGPYDLSVGEGARAIGDDDDVTAGGGKFKAKGRVPSVKMKQRIKARDDELKARGLEKKATKKPSKRDDVSAVSPGSSRYGLLPQLVDSVLDFLVPSAHAARKIKPPVEEPPAASTADQIKISVQEDGVYYLSTDAIAAQLGIKSNDVKGYIRSGGIAMSNHGLPVAWLAADGNNGLSFYGAALREPESTFTNDNIYWLEVAGGARMDIVSGAPSGSGDPAATFTSIVDAEDDVSALLAKAKEPGDDFWFWNFIRGDQGQSGDLEGSFLFDAPGATGNGQVVITPRLDGWYSGDDNHVTVELNDVAVGSIRWLGSGAHSESLVVNLGAAGAALAASGNRLTIRAKLDEGASFSYVLIDGFEVAYESYYVADGGIARFRGEGGDTPVTVSGFDSGDIRVFDVSDAKQPKLVDGVEIATDDSGYTASLSLTDGADYFATTDDGVQPLAMVGNTRVELQLPAANAEYIVITSEDLRDSAQGFVDRRGGMLATFDEIVDEYNDGISSPLAIKKFIESAYTASNGKTGAVFLIGYGHYDYRGENNLVPPLLIGKSYNGAPADNLFGTVGGELKVAVGRLPALTSQEVSDYLAKVVGYENRSPSSDGKRTLLWSAGPPDTQNATAYDSGYFTAGSERIISDLQTSLYTSVRAYVGSSDTPTEADAKKLILDTVNGPDGGVWIWNYAGHASPSRLGNGIFATPTDLDALTNGSNTPLLVALSCHINRFHFPGQDALGADLLLKADGGAIAVWAPAAPTANLVTKELGEQFFKSVIDDGETVLGRAVLKALSSVGPSGYQLNNLLGDPGLQLQSSPVIE